MDIERIKEENYWSKIAQYFIYHYLDVDTAPYRIAKQVITDGYYSLSSLQNETFKKYVIDVYVPAKCKFGEKPRKDIPLSEWIPLIEGGLCSCCSQVRIKD